MSGADRWIGGGAVGLFGVFRTWVIRLIRSYATGQIKAPRRESEAHNDEEEN